MERRLELPQDVLNVNNAEPVTLRHAGDRVYNRGGARPVGGSIFACFDGSAQLIDFITFSNWSRQKPGPMWCNPGRILGDQNSRVVR